MAKRRPAVTLSQLARALKLDKSIVYRWVEKGALPVMSLRNYHKKGNFIVKREDAVWIVHNWKRSCTPTEAARILGIPEGSAWHFIRNKVFQSIKIAGLNRVVLASVPEAREHIGKDVVNPGLVGFARYSPEKRRELSRISHKHYQFTEADRQKGGRRMNQVLIETGKAHRWVRDSEEAREVSRMGVEARRNKKRATMLVEDVGAILA